MELPLASSSSSPNSSSPLALHSSHPSSPSPRPPSPARTALFTFACCSCSAHLNHVQFALRLSVTTNVCIVLGMGAVAISTKSLALLSALVENMIDLLVQGFLCYAAAQTANQKDRAKFPAGTSRFEPVAVIVAASMMILISLVFIESGVTKLVTNIHSDEPEAPVLSKPALSIAAAAVSTKVFMIFYTRWVLRYWPSAAVEAIHIDNRNDVISNSFAIVAYAVASAHPSLWYIDPSGAILIFFLIMISWFRMGKEQMMQLVGVCATPAFVKEVTTLCHDHHRHMTLDMVRAYHFGSKYLVELDVVVPGDMPVKLAHDIALQLQFKVEQHDDVERAFVHVDYQQREYDEHIVSHEQDALLTYTGYTADDHGPHRSQSESSSHSSANSADELLRDANARSLRLDILEIPTPHNSDGSKFPFQAC